MDEPMPAPLGNAFWNNRSKHGRDTLFETPGLMWEAATEYFMYCHENPWIKIEFNGKDADRCEVPTARPFSLSGLCLYLDCGKNYFEQFEKSKAGEDFSGVITRIREVIDTQQFEGAAVGAFNANIISRTLGLTDKKEILAVGTHRVRRDEESGDIVIDMGHE